MLGWPANGYAGYLARAAQQWPTRIGLHFEGMSWTYSRLQQAASATASRLADAGVTHGARVLLLMENRPEYLIAQYALAQLGAVFVTPNPYWTEVEITRAIDVSGATAAIYEPRFDWVATKVPCAVPVDVVGDGAAPQPPCVALDLADAQYIPFSSGTTGLPKGVLHSNSSLCGGVEQLRYHLGLSDTDRIPIALPLCHIFGSMVTAAAMSVGAPVTLFRRFDLDEALCHLHNDRPTIWPIAGTVAQRLAGRTDISAAEYSSLRYFLWGGSAPPSDLAAKLFAHSGIRFLCSYGMTEAMVVAFNPVDRPDQWQLDSPGYAALGNELSTGADGELLVRGPSVAGGYVGGSSEEFGADGWFRTGDLVQIESNGRLRIVDRLKDVLKVSGFQVAPAEIEAALISHPDVVDAAVVGRPDEAAGEIPVAVVVARRPVAPEVLDSFLRPHVASYKRPREYRFADDLPRTPAGKLQRNAIRTQFADQADSPGAVSRIRPHHNRSEAQHHRPPHG